MATVAEERARLGAIGRSVPRREDRPLLTGEGCFVDDLHLSGALHAAVLRSPHAHARIVDIDTRRASAHRGVALVLTAQDLPDGGAPIPMRMFRLPGMERYLQRPLAVERVRYSGEPVAVVVAESRYVAEDALEAIDVAYEPLQAILDGHAAIGPNAPLLFPETGTNLAANFTIDRGSVAEAFDAADVVVEERIACQRHAAVPLEPRGLAAELDRTGRLTVWGAAKIVHVNRGILASMLGWPEDRIRLVELDVGGGFGARGEFYPEDFLIPFCALTLDRPVSWTEDREESMRALNHSREQIHEIALALAGDGTFLGLRDRITFNTGAYVRTHGTTVPAMTAGLLQGPYLWQTFHCEVRHVVANKTPAGTFRAPGRYEGNLARERAIDIAARRLGRDPADLRRQNLLPPDMLPYDTGSHTDGHPVVYDSADYPLLLDKGLARFDYDSMRGWRDAPAGASRRRGLGLGYFVEKAAIGRWDWARVSLTSDGELAVHSGAASVGQGVDTVLAQICADGLGVAYEDVAVVVHGDTDRIPFGMGAFGSRATMLAGTAVMQAAVKLRERILVVAAELLDTSPAELELDGHGVRLSGESATVLTYPELARAVQPEAALRRGTEPGLCEESFFFSDDMCFPYGLHCAAVEIDVETGGVHVHRYVIAYDVGRAINPALVEGQIVGGAAQGIGGALLEELAYDEAGQLVSASFADYLIPTACEALHVEVLVTEDAPTPLSPLGAKGAGEGGTAAVGAAIANAVSDALGQEVKALPLTPERIVRLARGEAP